MQMESVRKENMIKLLAANYHPAIRRMMENLIEENQNKMVQKQGKPYIVTDWDNTAIIFDSQQSLFIHQIETLNYRLTPERFREIIAMDLKEEKKAEVAELIEEIACFYRQIYESYQAMTGDKKLKEVKATEAFIGFKNAMACLYKYPFGHYVECCRILYLFENYTLEEVADLTEESIAVAKQTEPQRVEYHFLSGEKEWRATYHLGMRFVPEQMDFFATCRENGVEVYVCSASHKTVVEVHAAYYGIPRENVYALELVCGEEGLIQAEIAKEKPHTVKEGKAQTIADLIQPMHQREPLLIMGDSMGDFAMMRDFAEKIVIVETKHWRTVKETLSKEKKGQFHIWLQAREDEKGIWSSASLEN